MINWKVKFRLVGYAQGESVSLRPPAPKNTLFSFPNIELRFLALMGVEGADSASAGSKADLPTGVTGTLFALVTEAGGVSVPVSIVVVGLVSVEVSVVAPPVEASASGAGGAIAAFEASAGASSPAGATGGSAATVGSTGATGSTGTTGSIGAAALGSATAEGSSAAGGSVAGVDLGSG